MLRAGHTSSPGDPSPSTQPRTVNVVLFGETGVGKSSVINLIARKEVAKVSSDVNGCTMQSTRYDIPFDDMSFSIFDTIGLEEPQMGVNGYLKAIERAYELIVKLGAAGGIHLLLFCMRGGRITATTQSNYRLFCECLCNTKVPIALVFTGLEREVEMEDWWKRNKTHIEHYGIKSDGHACITAVQDEAPGEDLKYMESQKRIRELLKTCALKNEAFLPEPHTWFAKLGKGMRSFIEKHRNPKRRDVMRVLTNRCKLDPETARKIAEMMEKGDTETNDGNQREPVAANSGVLLDQQQIPKTMMEKGQTKTNDGNQREPVAANSGVLLDQRQIPNTMMEKGHTETNDGNQREPVAANSGVLLDQQQIPNTMMEKGQTETNDGNQREPVAANSRALPDQQQIAEMMMEKGDTETNDGNHREPVAANSGALLDQQQIAEMMMEKGDTETNDGNHRKPVAANSGALLDQQQIAEMMMEKGDTETNDGNHREPVVANFGALSDQQQIPKMMALSDQQKIAEMMEKGDTETNDRNQGEQVGNEGGPNPVVGEDDNEPVKASNSDALSNQQKIAEMIGRGNTKDQDEQVGDKEGKGGSNPIVGKDDNELVKKNAANSDALPNQHVNVAAPRNDAAEGKVERGDLGLDDGRPKTNKKWKPTPDSRGQVQARHDTKKKPGAGPFEVTLQSKSSDSWQVISHGS